MSTVVGLGVISAVAEALLPVGVGLAVDTITQQRVGRLWPISVGLVAVVVIRILGSVLRRKVSKDVEIDAVVRGKARAAEHLLRHPLAPGGGISAGDAIEIVETDATTISSGIHLVGSVVSSAVVYLAVASYLVASAPLLGVAVVVAPLAVAVALPRLSERIGARVALQRDLAGEVALKTSDAVSGLVALQGLHGQNEFLRQYGLANGNLLASGRATAGLRALGDAVAVLLPSLLLVTILTLGTHQWYAGSVTVGALVATYGLGAYLIGPATTLLDAADDVADLRVACVRMARLLSGSSREVSGADPLRAWSEFADLPTGLTLAQGETVAVVGMTVAEADRAAARIAGASEELGAQVDGRALESFDKESLREQVLLVSGDEYLFAQSVDEALAAPDALARDAALSAVALGAELAPRGGGQAAIQDGGVNFSGGQQQRLKIARAVARQPELLVVVEPTRSIDSATAGVVASRLMQLRRDKTNLYFTDSPAFLQAADRVLVYDPGSQQIVSDPAAGGRATTTIPKASPGVDRG